MSILFPAGIIRASLETSAAYAKEREAFGSPIVQHQMIQAKIAHMILDFEAARLVNLQAGW